MIDENFGIEVNESKKAEPSFATISEITQTGIKILIDGADVAGDKEYKCNACASFAVGDRVKISKKSGSYVVEFPLGDPMSKSLIPSGGTDGQVVMKDGNEEGAVKWGTITEYDGPTIKGSGVSTLGFFGSAGAYKRSVTNITNYTSYNSAICTKINDIIAALRAYGLI